MHTQSFVFVWSFCKSSKGERIQEARGNESPPTFVDFMMPSYDQNIDQVHEGEIHEYPSLRVGLLCNPLPPKGFEW